MDLLALGTILTTIRDIVFIVFFGIGIALLAFVFLIALVIFRKVGGLMDAVKGNLESTKTTLGNTAAASTIITEAVIKPIIKTSSFIAGTKQGVSYLLKLSKIVGGG